MLSQPDEPVEDELLAGGGLPRWTRWLALVAALAAGIALLVTHLPSKPASPAAAPVTTLPRVAPVTPDPGVVDVAAAGADSVVLKAASLELVSGSQVVRSVSLSWLPQPPSSVTRLAVDVVAHHIWVVVTNAVPTRMVEFAEATLHPLRTVVWPQLLLSAVAYAGHVYVTTDFGVADLPPGASAPHFMAGLAGAVGSVAVDAPRHRLVAIDLGYPTEVWTFRPGRQPVESPVLLDLSKGTVTVVDDAIWIGGFTATGAVLVRLDPRTLRPVLRARPALFGPGAVIVGAGSRVLWIEPAVGSPLLGCVSAKSGHPERTWQLPGVQAVVSDHRGALLATASGALHLALGRCEG